MNGLLECEIGCQELTVKTKKKKEVTTKNIKKKNPSSKIFKCLLYCIYNGLHGHMLSTNEEKTEFEVKLRDKKNKKEWKDKDISLFVALDSVSSKCRDKIKYAEKTKNRFKSNMSKLVKSKYLDYLGERKEPKSLVVRKYRILKYPDGVEEALMWKRSDKIFKKCSSESITGSYRTPVQNNFNYRAVSDYSCLSRAYLKVGLGENMSYENTGNVVNRNVGLGENRSYENTGNVVNCNVGLGENMSYENTGNVVNCNVGLGESMSYENTGNVRNRNVGLGENVSYENSGNVGNDNVSLGENMCFQEMENIEEFCNLLQDDFNELDEFKNEIFPESLITNQEIPDFSVLDDNTMFEDIEKNYYNITDPLLSSAMELDQSPTYDWHSDCRVFDLDENILDVKFN